ncbi:MAG: hypothetical protein MJ182_06635 [Treponema sp.]|nr:hypothetical protein [Treponema sp.]
MKKILIALLILTAVCFGAFAADSDTSKTTHSDGSTSEWSTFSYESIPILKIMESKEGYVVIYQKYKYGVGSTVIPKSWARGNPDNPRKLKFRKLDAGIVKPYMTVVKKEGNFHRVILTIPMNKSDAIWGSVRQISEGLDKENLDDIVL